MNLAWYNKDNTKSGDSHEKFVMSNLNQKKTALTHFFLNMPILRDFDLGTPSTTL